MAASNGSGVAFKGWYWKGAEESLTSLGRSTASGGACSETELKQEKRGGMTRKGAIDRVREAKVGGAARERFHGRLTKQQRDYQKAKEGRLPRKGSARAIAGKEDKLSWRRRVLP